MSDDPWTPRTLSQLTRAHVITDVEVHEFYKEIRNNSDRTACIMLASALERNLEHAILARLRIDITDQDLIHTLLFERDGALSTFSGNIRFGRALGYYDKQLQNDFDVIRRVRNAFAHSAVPVTFQTPLVKKTLSELPMSLYKPYIAAGMKFPKRYSDERKLFTACCLLLTQLLWTRTDHEQEKSDLAIQAIEKHREEVLSSLR